MNLQPFHKIAVDASLVFSAEMTAALERRSATPLQYVDTATARSEVSPEVDALVCGWGFDLDAPLLARLPQLRYVGLRCTSLHRIATDELARRAIACRAIHAYGDIGTVEFVMESLLFLLRERTRNRTGNASELHATTLAIVGYGEVGRKVAALALAFGMRVLVVGRRDLQLAPDGPLMQVPLAQALEQADVLSFHTPAYVNVLDSAMLERLKPGVNLLFTTLGMPVDPAALDVYLGRNPAAAAMLDQCARSGNGAGVVERENCYVRPFYAARTHESIVRAEQELLGNMAAFQRQGGAPGAGAPPAGAVWA